MRPCGWIPSIFDQALRLGALAALPALASCSGSIGDAPDFSWGRGPAGSISISGTGPDGTNKGYAPLTPAEAPMRRLTQQQYQNTIADIFGADIKTTVALENDETNEMFLSISASRVGTSDRGAEQYHDAAFDVAAQVFQRAANYDAVAKCSPTAASDPCIATFVKTFGQKLWRRPLSTDEVTRYTAIAGAAGSDAASLQAGMKYVLATLLQSPNFLYMVQLGEPDDNQPALRFTSYEMASRLSYFLWNSTPDQTLLAAPAQNHLVTPDASAPPP